jgi:LysM repeat protein
MWIAHWTYAYGENIKPDEMAGWSPYTFWQYSGERDFLDGITNVNGAPVKVDFDVFKGTLEELYTLAGVTAPASTKYTIKDGDTLENIAKKFNVSLVELVNANPQILTTGRKLTIPQPAGAGTPPSGTPIDPTPGIPPDSPGGEPITYTVKSGDTLSAIALRFGTTVKAIADANNIPDPNLIHVGQVLKIP